MCVIIYVIRIEVKLISGKKKGNYKLFNEIGNRKQNLHQTIHITTVAEVVNSSKTGSKGRF